MKDQLKKFRVKIYQIYSAEVEVEAHDEDHALDLVSSGKGTDIEGSEEYVEVTNQEEWTVEEIVD